MRRDESHVWYRQDILAIPRHPDFKRIEHAAHLVDSGAGKFPTLESIRDSLRKLGLPHGDPEYQRMVNRWCDVIYAIRSHRRTQNVFGDGKSAGHHPASTHMSRSSSDEAIYLDKHITEGDPSRERLKSMFSGEIPLVHLSCRNRYPGFDPIIMHGNELGIEHDVVKRVERHAVNRFNQIYRPRITFVLEDYRKAMRFIIPHTDIYRMVARTCSGKPHLAYIATLQIFSMHRMGLYPGVRLSHRTVTPSIGVGIRKISPASEFRIAFTGRDVTTLMKHETSVESRANNTYSMHRFIFINNDTGYKIKIVSVYHVEVSGFNEPIVYSARYKSSTDSFRRAMNYADSAIKKRIDENIEALIDP